ncbi:YwpF family protein [Peribacillus alkalitolerans]|uniref:YwpF family protein n=1 Tax=Peribacillus alkalitolerans TaxID=1550385 RepID=UPI0013D1D5D7|nr:YwpF family protein [Peribacillus alkalitolerans]
MKSFKLVSFQIITGIKQAEDVELQDGLIINKEDEHNRWLIEAFVTEEEFLRIEPLLKKDTIWIQVVITKKENDPAAFETKVLHMKKVQNNYTILFEGHLKNLKIEYAELLLENLIQQGVQGEQLVEEFKKKIRIRPKISTNLKK